MIPLDLSHAELNDFEAGLALSHEIAVRTRLFNRNRELIAELSDLEDSVVEDGEVQVNGREAISKQLTLTLADPRRRLQIDPSSPSASAIYIDNEIEILQGHNVKIAGAWTWVWVPLFYGGLTKFNRSGYRVSLEAQSKEMFGVAPEVFWQPRTFRRHTPKTDVIKGLLRGMGERTRDLDIPDLAPKIPREASFGRHQEPMKAAKKMAQSMNRQLLARGDGTWVLRRYPDHPIWVFDEERHLEQAAELAFDYERIRNQIEVLGPEPQTNRERIRAVASAPHDHPLSPGRLARNGEPRYLVERIENRQVRRPGEAADLAERILRDRLRGELAAAFNSILIPHLEPGDLVALKARGYRLEFRLWEFSVPVRGGLMAVGSQKRVGSSRGKVKTRSRGDRMLRGKELRAWENKQQRIAERAKFARYAKRHPKAARKAMRHDRAEYRDWLKAHPKANAEAKQRARRRLIDWNIP